MKVCTGCKHYAEFGSYMDVIRGCRAENIIDPVDGKQIYRRCSAARDVLGLCGPDGKLWEAKP